ARIQNFTGTRDALIRQGVSPQQAQILAADAARNTTANFHRSGEWGRVLNVVLPYFNAGIQGSRQLVRSFKDRPAETTFKVTTAIFAPVAVTTAWNLADPQRRQVYNDLQE